MIRVSGPLHRTVAGIAPLPVGPPVVVTPVAPLPTEYTLGERRRYGRPCPHLQTEQELVLPERQSGHHERISADTIEEARATCPRRGAAMMAGDWVRDMCLTSAHEDCPFISTDANVTMASHRPARPQAQKRDPMDDIRIARWYRNGVPIQTIANRIGYSLSGVRYRMGVLRARGWDLTRRPAQPEDGAA